MWEEDRRVSRYAADLPQLAEGLGRWGRQACTTPSLLPLPRSSLCLLLGMALRFGPGELRHCLGRHQAMSSNLPAVGHYPADKQWLFHHASQQHFLLRYNRI